MLEGMRACVGCLLAVAAAPLARADGEPPAPSFTLSVGPAFDNQPKYPGASSQRSFLFPDVELQYDNWLYVSATDIIGVYAYNKGGTQAGAAITWDFTERRGHDVVPSGALPDVPTTQRLRLFFDPRLASSITMRGHEIMHATRKLIGAQGYEVIYGACWGAAGRTAVPIVADEARIPPGSIGRRASP